MKKWITAEELMAKLEKDTDYQERIKAKLEQQRQNIERSKLDQKELLDELHVTGHQIESVWDFVNTDNRYPLAIETLIRHLDVEHHSRTIEGIARALMTPDARGIAVEPLIRRFLATSNDDFHLKWAIGMSIGYNSTPETLNQIMPLILDRSHGKTRGEMVCAIMHLPKEEALALSEQLLADPDVAENALKVHKRLTRSMKRKK